MSKTKNYFWDLAEQESDTIINKYVKDEITEKEEVNEEPESRLRNEIRGEVEKEYNMRTKIRTEI